MSRSGQRSIPNSGEGGRVVAANWLRPSSRLRRSACHKTEKVRLSGLTFRCLIPNVCAY
jgi:hypothetical protein